MFAGVLLKIVTLELKVCIIYFTCLEFINPYNLKIFLRKQWSVFQFKIIIDVLGIQMKQKETNILWGL